MKVVAPLVLLGFYLCPMNIWYWHYGTGFLPERLCTEPTHVIYDPTVGWFYSGALISYTSYLIWNWGGLKRVEVVQGGLLVSNYLVTIRIPIEQVESVDEGLGLRSTNLGSMYDWRVAKPIHIRLTKPTIFGKTITFMPVQRPDSKVNPTTVELRKLAGLE